MNLEEIRAERDKKIARLLRYFGVIMAIFYFVMGLAFILLPWFDAIAPYTRYGTAVLLMAYGCFRFYRMLKSIKQLNPANKDEN